MRIGRTIHRMLQTFLAELKRRNVPAYLANFGTELQERINASGKTAGFGVKCGGLAVHPHLDFPTTDPTVRSQLSTLYIQEMAKRGCHGYASFYLNAAQGSAELDQTAAAATETFAILAEGLDRGALAELLECAPQQEAFRRLVR